MNLPNRLSILRIIMIPFFVACYFIPYAYMPIVAVGIFVLAAFTDFLDGYIARRYNLVSDLGKLLDPIADKLLITAALFVVVATNPLGGWYGILLACCSTIIIARELLISAVRQIATTKGIVIQANIWGKIKTVVQDIALPLLIILQCWSYGFTSSAVLYDVTWYTAIVLFVLATVLTVLSGVIYLVVNSHVFYEEKK